MLKEIYQKIVKDLLDVREIKHHSNSFQQRKREVKRKD